MATRKTYISLTSDMVARVDKIATYYGVTRSAYLAMIIGQTVAASEKALEAIPDVMDKAINTAK